MKICCIHAELLVFPLLKPPSWISDFRLPHIVWEIASLNSSTLKTSDLPLKFCGYVVYRLRYKYFRFVSRHFGFLTSAFIAQYRGQRNFNRQPWKHMFSRWNFSAMLYTCWDISISSLRTAILDLWLPLTPQNIENSFIEFPDQENIDITVGIFSYLAYNQSYWFFKVFQKITASCSRHLGFLSEDIDAISVTFCSPTIFRKSQKHFG